MKLTRKQIRELANVMHHLARALVYINSPQIAVARRSDRPTTTLCYTRADGATLYEVNKDIGSDLCGLQFAADALNNFLQAHIKPAA